MSTPQYLSSQTATISDTIVYVFGGYMAKDRSITTKPDISSILFAFDSDKLVCLSKAANGMHATAGHDMFALRSFTLLICRGTKKEILLFTKLSPQADLCDLDDKCKINVSNVVYPIPWVKCEGACDPGCMEQENPIATLQRGYSNNSIEIKDSPCPTQMIPDNISGTSRLNNYHLEGTDSISSLDDLQKEGNIFDHEPDMLDNFVTKSDITRIEMQQEIILTNQQVILDRLSGISRLLNERAKKKGTSPLGGNRIASSSLSSVSVTTSTLDTEATKVILPSTANGQKTSTCGKAKSTKMLQSLFPSQNSINVDDILGEEPRTPKTSTLTPEDAVVNENKLLLKDIHEMVGNAY